MTRSGSSARIDVWLWAVRVFRTRTAATSACTAGGVRVNGKLVKASRHVEPGDLITLRASGRPRILEVVETPAKRVGAALAAEAMIDSSPPPEARAAAPTAQAVREPGTGRPTKRDRRQIERLRNRDGRTDQSQDQAGE